MIAGGRNGLDPLFAKAPAGPNHVDGIRYKKHFPQVTLFKDLAALGGVLVGVLGVLLGHQVRSGNTEGQKEIAHRLRVGRGAASFRVPSAAHDDWTPLPLVVEFRGEEAAVQRILAQLGLRK
jgi:hypothetical protein